MGLKIYEGSSNGVALGSTIVVISTTKTKALNAINTKLKQEGFNKIERDQVSEIGIYSPSKTQVVYFNNGDY